MSEGMRDQSKDAVQAAVTSLPENDFLSQLSASPGSVGAANDNHRSRPYVPFSPGWYVTCLGDNDLG